MIKNLTRGEIIKITNNNDFPPEAFGQEFVVRHVFEPCEKYGEYYGIVIEGHVYCVYMGDFETTGKFGEIEPMSDTSVKISVSQDGMGKITQIIVEDKDSEK